MNGKVPCTVMRAKNAHVVRNSTFFLIFSSVYAAVDKCTANL